MRGAEKNFHHFVKQLIVSDGIKRVSTFAIISGLSRRMIYYYLDELNYYLKNHNTDAYIQGQPLKKEQKRMCQQIICKNEKNENDRIFSVDERKIIMFYHILFETQRITISFFEELFLISKNTVLKDFMILRELLEQFNIDLHVNKKNGYFLEIDEFQRRQLTYTYFHILSTPKSNAVSPYIISLIKEKQPLWNEKNIGEIISMLHSTSSILSKNMAEDDALILAQTLLSLEERSVCVEKIDIPINVEKIVTERLEFEAATIFSEKLEKITKRKNTHAERVVIGMYLLCVEKDIDQHYLAPQFQNHYNISRTLINLFQSRYGITFYNSESILKNVQTYIKVAYYRNLLQIYIPNKSYRIVLARYPKVFQIIERLVDYISQTMPVFKLYFSKGFTPDMVSDLTVIFEDAILREQTRSCNLQAIIVSDSSKVERSLIQSHITQHLPMIHVVDTFSYKDVGTFTLPIELCITSLDNYEHSSGKTIHIHSIPTEEDIEKIQQLQFEFFHLRKRRLKIKHLLEELNETNDIETTLNEIEHVYMGLKKTRVNRKELTFSDYVHNKKHIFIYKTKVTLADIIKKSCKNFINRNSATIQYQDELLKNMQENMVYMYKNKLIICGDYRKGSLNVDIQINYLSFPITYDNNQINEIYLLVSTENMRQVPLLFEIEDKIL